MCPELRVSDRATLERCILRERLRVLPMKLSRLVPFFTALLCACEGAGFPVLGAEGVREAPEQSPGENAMGGSPSVNVPPLADRIERERPSDPLPEFDHWGEPQALAFSSLESRDQDPFLRFDGLELYFSSLRDGSQGQSNIWAVTRPNRGADWGEPFPVASLNSNFSDATPEMSQDGLYLIFARSDGTSYALYETRRDSLSAAWNEPQRMLSLGDEGSGISPSLSHDALTLAFNRSGEALDVDVFIAYRATPEGTFGEATSFAALNSDHDDWDVCLGDGLFVVLAQSQQLVFAERASLSEDFGPKRAISSLNTEWREFDPWLSVDRQHMLFASDREGSDRIYEVFLE